MFRRTREAGDTLAIYQGVLPENSNDRFFSSLVYGQTEDQMVRMFDGTVAYKILGYAKDVDEAQIALYGRTFPRMATPGVSCFL